MTKILIQLCSGLIAYFVVYVIYLITVINKPKKLEKFQKGTELSILKKKFNVEVNEDNKVKISKMVAQANSFIIAVTFSIVTLFNNMWLSLIIGFVMIIIMILITYTIIGKKMQKLGVK